MLPAMGTALSFVYCHLTHPLPVHFSTDFDSVSDKCMKLAIASTATHFNYDRLNNYFNSAEIMRLRNQGQGRLQNKKKGV